MLHDRPQRLPPCALPLAAVARKEHSLRCASGISPGAGGSGGTHAGDARVAAARPCLSVSAPHARARTSSGGRCAAPPAPAPLPLRCLHAEDRATGRPGHHAMRACDASLCLRVRRLLQPAALRSGRRRTRAYGHVAVESRGCPPLGALDGSGLSTS